jgi:exodeoxyribonuclease VII large subunit
VVPDRIEVGQAIASMQRRHHQRLASDIDAARERVARRALAFQRALPDVQRWRRDLGAHADRLRLAAASATTHARRSTDHAISRIQALSPLATLDRGYAIVSRADGGVVTAAADVAPGDRVAIRWRDGARPARVESG